jgi:hypothetical protein
MTLQFTLNDIEPIWIPGNLPLAKTKSRKVKVRLVGKTSSHFPQNYIEIGELLTGARPSRPDYYITLLLTYRHSTDLPSGATTYGQIRIPLPAEAISLIRESDGGEKYSYELTLENVELENKTRRKKA